MAPPGVLRYLRSHEARRAAGNLAHGPAGDDRGPGPARLPRPARLASSRTHSRSRGGCSRTRALSPRRSRHHGLELHVAVAQELLQRVKLVLALVEHTPDAGVDEHLETMDARGVGDVDVGVLDRGAVSRRLRDGVDLGVDGAEAVLLDVAGRRA